MGDTSSEKSTTLAHENGHFVKLEDVDVAATLDSNISLQPEAAAKLRSAPTPFCVPDDAT